jgi:hypothetical protein
MFISFCHQSSPLDFQDPCIRGAWSAIAPITVVLLACLSGISLPQGPVKDAYQRIISPFKEFITLAEAEALQGTENTDENIPKQPEESPFWRPVALSGVALFQSLVWFSIASYRLITNINDVWYGVQPVLIAISWLYASIRIILYPVVTVPYDLFALYLVQFSASIILLSGTLYDSSVFNIAPAPHVLVGLIANVLAIMVLLGIILQMPMTVPSGRIRKEDIVRIIFS